MSKTKNKNQAFDALAWVRKIRDRNYEKYKHLSTKEYVELINDRAQEFLKDKKLRKKVS